MQEFSRDGLTSEQVEALIRSASITVDFGLDVLDHEDNFLRNVDEDFYGGKIDRNMRDTIHGTCTLYLSDSDITWANERLRPFMTIKDDITGDEARFDLGVYLPVEPQRMAGEIVDTEVICHDKLEVLNVPVGSMYQARSGASYVETVEALIREAGETSIDIDQSYAGMEVLSTLTFNAEDTYLEIINELLAAIGYVSLYTDEQGVFTSEPFVALEDRTAEWDYDTANEKTTVMERMTEHTDFFNVPNVFIVLNQDPGVDPTDDAGRYEFKNQSNGISSIDSRKREIKTIERVKAANETALILRAQKLAEEARQNLVRVKLNAGPNPLHWHRDCVNLTASMLNIDSKFAVKRFTLPLDGSDMEMELIQ